MLDVHDPNNVLPDEDFPEAARRFPPLADLAEAISRHVPSGNQRADAERLLYAFHSFLESVPDAVGARYTLAKLMMALHNADLGVSAQPIFEPKEKPGNRVTSFGEHLAKDLLVASRNFLVKSERAAPGEPVFRLLASDLAAVGVKFGDVEPWRAIRNAIEGRADVKARSKVGDYRDRPIDSDIEYQAVLRTIAEHIPKLGNR